MILNSPYISGSLTVTGNIISSGSITISGSIASASYASNAERVDGLDSTSFVFTSSYNTDSASVSTRVTKIEGNYATTGSNIFTGAQTVCANITSTGTIIAQTLNVQQVTSSIVYSSGSNIFGNQLTDIQQMTGSLRVSGSSSIILGSLGVGGGANETFGVTGPTGSLGMVRWTDGVATSAFLGISGSTSYIHANNNILALGTGTNNNLSTKLTISGSYVAVNGNSGLSCVPYLQGMSLGWNRSNGQGESMINFTDQGGGSNPSLTFNYRFSTGLCERMRIDCSGNVGIGGLPGDGYRLQIVGTSQAQTTIGQTYAGVSAAAMKITSGGDWTFGIDLANGATERLRITSAGMACFACQVCAPQASFVGPYVQNTVALNAAWAGVGGFTATLTCASGVQPYATYTFGNGNVVISTNNPTIRFQTITTTTADMMQIVGASYVSSGPYNCNKISALNSSHLSLETGGSPRLLIDNAGNVGIGTCSPGYKLDVYTSGATSAIRINSDTSQNSQLRLEENGTVKFAITYVPSDATTRFYFAGAGSDLVTLKSGNFGIACTSPAYPLHVNGQIYSTSTVSAANSRILNQQSSNTYTNNSANIVTGAIPEVSGIIRVINNLDGTNTDIPFYASGGSGIAYQWTVLDPDSGWLINQSGWNFNFTTNGSQSRTFNLQASNGSGNVTIQQASGTANYTMKIFIYSQG